MSEQKLQSKILAWLQDHGFYCIKVMKASKSGVPDIVGCTPKGRFFAVEVKYGSNTPSALQTYNVKEINNRGGIACVAWDLETVIERLKHEITY